MNKINQFYCRQFAMKLSTTSVSKMTEEEKVTLDKYKKQAKRLESSQRLQDDLETALEQVGDYLPDKKVEELLVEKQ